MRRKKENDALEKSSRLNSNRLNTSQDDIKPKKKKAKVGDEIDNIVTRFMEDNDLKLPFEWLAEGKYKYGGKVVNIKIYNGHAMVRIGGGWQSMKEFCTKNEPEELKKMTFIVQDANSTPTRNRAGTPTQKGKLVKMSGTLTPTASSTNITSSLKDKVGGSKLF